MEEEALAYAKKSKRASARIGVSRCRRLVREGLSLPLSPHAAAAAALYHLAEPRTRPTSRPGARADPVVSGQCDANRVCVHVATMTTVVRHRHRHHHNRQFWCAALAAVAATAVVRLPAATSAASATGNGLWDDLLGKCDGPRNTMDCVRSRLYGYVETAFEADFNVTDGLRFTRNANDYEAVCRADTAGAYRQARAVSGSRGLRLRRSVCSARVVPIGGEVTKGWGRGQTVPVPLVRALRSHRTPFERCTPVHS